MSYDQRQRYGRDSEESDDLVRSLAARYQLDADVASGGAARAVEHARDLVRSHHSWARRAEQIYARLSTGRPLEPQSLRYTVAATT